MGHVRFKANVRDLARTNNARQKGQFQLFDFCNLGNNFHVIKSKRSKKNVPNAGTHVSNEQHVEPFDGFASTRTVTNRTAPSRFFASVRAVNAWSDSKTCVRNFCK